MTPWNWYPSDGGWRVRDVPAVNAHVVEYFAGGSQCHSKPKTDDGYCTIHDPKRMAAKRAEREAKRNEQSRLNVILYRIEAARRDAWAALTVDSTDAQIVAVVRAALVKIAKLEASR